MIRRREFITLLGGAAAWPLTARAQHRPAKTPLIGIIDDAPIWDHFRQGLSDLGYVEGRDIVFEYRSAEGQPDRLAAVAGISQAFRSMSSSPTVALQLEPPGKRPRRFRL
jgi:putative ABC transport system substrate-binding protein